MYAQLIEKITSGQKAEDIQAFLEGSEADYATIQTALNQQDINKMTAMHYACEKADPGLIRLLLSYDPDLTIKDKHERMPEQLVSIAHPLSLRIKAIFSIYHRWSIEIRKFDIKLNRLLFIARQVLEKMPALSEDLKPGALFFGNTKTGKSTLINFLLGIMYSLNEKGKLMPHSEEFTKISHKFRSETLYPSFYELAGRPYTLVDLAGFGDNRDSEKLYSIISALIVKMMAKRIKAVQSLVMIMSWHEIEEKNLDHILKPLKQIAIMLQGQKSLISNLVLCITKTDTSKFPPENEEIIDNFRMIYEAYKNRPESNVEIDNCIKALLGALISGVVPVIVSDVTNEERRNTVLKAFEDIKAPLSIECFNFTDFNEDFEKLKVLYEKLKDDHSKLVDKLKFLEWKAAQSASENLKKVLESLPSIGSDRAVIPALTSIEDGQVKLTEDTATLVNDIKVNLAKITKPKGSVEIAEDASPELLRFQIQESEQNLRTFADFIGIPRPIESGIHPRAETPFAGAAAGAGDSYPAESLRLQ